MGIWLPILYNKYPLLDVTVHFFFYLHIFLLVHVFLITKLIQLSLIRTIHYLNKHDIISFYLWNLNRPSQLFFYMLHFIDPSTFAYLLVFHFFFLSCEASKLLILPKVLLAHLFLFLSSFHLPSHFLSFHSSATVERYIVLQFIYYRKLHAFSLSSLFHHLHLFYRIHLYILLLWKNLILLIT